MDTQDISNGSGEAAVYTSSEAPDFQVTLAPSNPDSEKLERAFTRLETLQFVQELLQKQKSYKGKLHEAIFIEKCWKEKAQNCLDQEEETTKRIQHFFKKGDVENGLKLDQIQRAMIKRVRSAEELAQEAVQLTSGLLESVQLPLQKLQSTFDMIQKESLESEKCFQEVKEKLSEELVICREGLRSDNGPVTLEKLQMRTNLQERKKCIKKRLEKLKEAEQVFKEPEKHLIPLTLEELNPQVEIARSNFLQIIKGITSSTSDLPQDLADVIASLVAGEFGDFTVEQDYLDDDEAMPSGLDEMESGKAKPVSPEFETVSGENLSGFVYERGASGKYSVYLLRASATEQKIPSKPVVKSIKFIIPAAAPGQIAKK